MTLAKRRPPSSPQHILAGAHGIATGVGRLVAWPPALLRDILALWHQDKAPCCRTRQHRAHPVPVPHGNITAILPACLRMTRMPTHRGLPSSSARLSLWATGLAPAFLLCTWEPWLCFGLLEVLTIYRET